MRAKVLTTVVLAAIAASSALPVEAKAPRRAQLPYEATDDSFYVAGGSDPAVVGTGDYNARYRFPVRRGETAVSVALVDESERAVGGIIRQYVVDYTSDDGSVSSGHAVTSEYFCGQTDAPVRIKKKLEVIIIVYEGVCEDGSPSAPTNGDIVVDFYKR